MDDQLLLLAYSTATLHPDSFDATAQELRGWSSDLHKCAASVQARLSELRSGSSSYCQDLADDGPRRGCNGADWLRISAVIDAVVLVVDGKTVFNATPSGAALAFGQQLLGAEQWHRLQTEALDWLDPLLSCN